MKVSDEKAKGIMQSLQGDTKASGMTVDEVGDWLQDVQKSLGVSEEEIQEFRQYWEGQKEEYLDEANACPHEVDIEKYLYLCEEASSDKQKKKYLEKALALDPDNLDVQYRMCVLEHEKSGDVLPYLEEILEKGKDRLQEKGFYEAAKGRFQHFRETQPYLRTLMDYMAVAYSYGMMRKAAAAGEEILECCSNEIYESRENFEGAWAKTLCIYADLEDAGKAMPLVEKMDEASRENAFYLLPLTFLYYKLGKWDVASQYVNALQKENKHLKKLLTWYFTGKLDKELEKVKLGIIGGDLENGTWNELLDAYVINEDVYKANSGFFTWVKGQLGRRKK